MKTKQQEKYLGSKIDELLKRYAIAQVEFEKIVGFKKAIEITVQIKRSVVGNELLSNCSEPQLKNVLKQLRSSYQRLLKERNNNDTSNSN